MRWFSSLFTRDFIIISIVEKKQNYRIKALKSRALDFGKGCDDAASKKMLTLLKKLPQSSVVSGYLPIRTEIDPRSIMKILSETHKICVPVIDKNGAPLKWREWQLDSKLTKGPFGAMVPSHGEWLRPNIMICPLVAFDTSCYRLGYGGGFYDRSISELESEYENVTTYGFAFDAQEIEVIPREKTDKRLDFIVTPTRVIGSGD